MRLLTPDEVKALGPVQWIKVETKEVIDREASELDLRVLKTRQDYLDNR